MKLSISSPSWFAGWTWTAVAGGGGLWLLFTRGPWPPTNGWFALFSGVAACPLVGWALQHCARIRISGWIQFAVAALIFVAGHAALGIWPHS